MVAAASRHYGRGTIAVGVLLLGLALIYMVQVGGVARHTLHILANPLATRASDGQYQFDLRTWAIHHFYFTSQAWVLAHLWLLWVVVLRLVRRPTQRGRIVAALAAAVLATLAATWSMVVWLANHGTSV
jgi:hypothetical protein